MHDFVRKLITEWRRLELPFGGETLVVGVSGGADSVSLLLGLHELAELGKLDLRIVAAHFNHRLRDRESDADEEFVKQLATERKMELAVGRAKPFAGGNLEQATRVARYDFLARTAENVGAFAVATGHTVNDQAETFLINLIRGSGPVGLCGMKAVRTLERSQNESAGPAGNENPTEPSECEPMIDDEPASDDPSPLLPFSSSTLLVRPLLTWAKRRDTEGLCHDLGVEYRYDTMNEDTAFKRVRIRKILLPLLTDFNPNIIDTLANTATLMQEIGGERNRAEIPDELIVGELQAMTRADLYQTLREWLAARRGTTRGLNLKHIQAIGRLVNSDKSGRVAELPGKARVVKSGGRLRYEVVIDE